MSDTQPTLREKTRRALITEISFRDYYRAAASGAVAVIGADAYADGNQSLMWLCIAAFSVFTLSLRINAGRAGLNIHWAPWEVKEFVDDRPVEFCGSFLNHNPHAWIPSVEHTDKDGYVWGTTDKAEAACLGHDCANPKGHMK